MVHEAAKKTENASNFVIFEHRLPALSPPPHPPYWLRWQINFSLVSSWFSYISSRCCKSRQQSRVTSQRVSTTPLFVELDVVSFASTWHSMAQHGTAWHSMAQQHWKTEESGCKKSYTSEYGSVHRVPSWKCQNEQSIYIVKLID